MMVTLTGPKDKPAMDINVAIDPISLTVSPAIVRLIIHAMETLIPKKVCVCIYVQLKREHKVMLNIRDSYFRTVLYYVCRSQRK